ncbi:hypothetical protein KZZ52_26750 [Dactylosporangium sp. AC04546]|uniref:hypothetical protein n=1 Tax=Dactylosporangium sp. AC04546 TaxID=2862460 RepID=UPI002E7B3B8C|nr:hypothetical protein [Dactylosporangium sp. AC04546]WVK88868.1 hypothetical protein KZZ52_26750 [Dactylosporangium sp. AC04546]
MFAQILRRHGVDPSAAADVETAWQAFAEFAQVEVDGIDQPDTDADGFMIQWGRYSWNNRRPSLSFTRQLAVIDTGDRGRQAEIWHVDLQMCFDDGPDLIGIDSPRPSDIDISFDPIGPSRAAKLAEMRLNMLRHPQLHAMWRAEPVSSDLSFECF